MRDDPAIGPNGLRYGPKIRPDDDGGLAGGLTVDTIHNRLILEFGTPVKWVGLTREMALAMSRQLAEKAAELAPADNQ